MFQISCMQGNREKRSIGIWCIKEMKPSLQVQKAAAKAMHVNTQHDEEILQVFIKGLICIFVWNLRETTS